MPPNATALKRALPARCGATVLTSSSASWADRLAALEAEREHQNAVVVSSSEDPAAVLGSATVALELLAQLPGEGDDDKLDAMIVPCGTGGLLAGTAITLRQTGTLVFGAEPSEGGADDVVRGLKAGRRITRVSSGTIADGLRCPVGKLPWEIIQRREYVEGVYSASDAQIRRAGELVRAKLGMVVEPSAVVGLAVVLFCEEFRRELRGSGNVGKWRVGVCFSGGNVEG
jgi:threonine dehydratase